MNTKIAVLFLFVTLARAADTNEIVRPGFVQQPQSVTVLRGESATFSVVVTGTPPIFYRWIRNGTPYATSSGPHSYSPTFNPVRPYGWQPLTLLQVLAGLTA